MSYREENGQVVLTMSRDEYCELLFALGMLFAEKLRSGHAPTAVLDFMNRLNEGNPNYTPYEVKA